MYSGLFTDLYQLTMCQAYWREGMDAPATFSLFSRKLPEQRNYLVACGLDDALSFLETVRFDAPALEYLESLGLFAPQFLEWLGNFRFRGDVRAVPEGSPVFANEPLLEVTAPITQAQLVETGVMNHVHVQTVLASKAARVVAAAGGRRVVDFGMRRTHGVDAAMRGARAFHVAGVAATSNVAAARKYGLEATGTMAHSYIQAHADELHAFEAFAALYPQTVLLVDTYDTLAGVEHVIAMAKRLGERFRVRAIRLDSGDLEQLARRARERLDAAGLTHVQIFASGGLDEYAVAALVDADAPINGFGVGTGMGVSKDAPALDMAYKLVEYGGEGRLKTSASKAIYPGRKQVFRRFEADVAVGDIIARVDEQHSGQPLLEPVMQGGQRLPAGQQDITRARQRCAAATAALPPEVRAIERAASPYPVGFSPALEADRQTLIKRFAGE